MEKRIALEKRGRPDDQITELILDNCRSTTIEGLTESFTSLKILSLINVGLVTLKYFPKLPSLRKLELSDNRISNGLSYLTGSPKLTHLNLSGNKIKDIEDLKPLKDLTSLQVLDLFNNEVTSMSAYREKIFELIPSLKYLDGFDREEIEAITDYEDDVNGEEESLEDDEDSSSSDLDDISDYEEEEEDNDISLAEVYNEDIEEDNSDWNEIDDEGEEDIDEPTDDEEDECADDDGEGEGETEAAEKAPVEVDGEAEEPEARGTKRKLEGNDG